MKFRLHITYDYEVTRRAAHNFYGTRNPEEVAAIDLQNLTENTVNIGEFVDNMEGRTNLAIEILER